MKLIDIQKNILGKEIFIFTALEFRRIMGLSPVSCQKLLERYTKKGFFMRLKGGIYALKTNPPSPYLLANKLYWPSYISFETALAYYGLIPETVYSYTSATTKTTRNFNSMGQHFIYHKIKKQAFSGYKLVKIGGTKILLADKEKALADYLYFVFLKKKNINDRLAFKGVKFKLLLHYAAFYKKPKYERWLKCLQKNR